MATGHLCLDASQAPLTQQVLTELFLFAPKLAPFHHIPHLSSSTRPVVKPEILSVNLDFSLPILPHLNYH